MKKQLKPHLLITESGVSVQIYTDDDKFVVQDHDRKRIRCYAFTSLEEASKFARFMACRQYWAQVAKKLGVRILGPVRSFPVGTSTSTLMAWDTFLRANHRHGASSKTIRDLVEALSAAFDSVSSGTINSLTAAWHLTASAPDHWSAAKRPRAQANVAKFLGWLSQQPLQAHGSAPAVPAAPVVDKQYLSVQEAELLLRACPDADARRYVALSLFAGLRSAEVANLRWEDLVGQSETFACQGKGQPRCVPLTANLMVWLQPPTPAEGPVVTDAAAHKVRALLGNLKSAGTHALRTTYLLCCLALHDPEAAAQSAGIGQVQEASHTALPIGRADAERLFSLAPS